MLKTRRNMSMTLKESLDNCTWKQKTKILRKNFSFWSVIRRLRYFNILVVWSRANKEKKTDFSFFFW